MATSKKRPAAKKPPGQRPRAPKTEWASANDLPTQPWTDRTLPILGKKVRIRFLGDLEQATLAVLPDLARFGELMAKDVLEPTDDIEERKQRAMEAMRERVLYMEIVAHLAVMDPKDKAEAPVECSCGMTHPPSLWTREQTTFLAERDLTFITQVAERSELLEAVRPLSPAKPESSSQQAANTGESTPPTN